MRLISFLAVLFSSLQISVQAFAQPLPNKKDEKILKHMEYDWLMAEFKLDTAAISKMMDESFVSIGTNSISTKQEELDGIYKNISKRIKDNHVVDSLYLDHFHVKIYGTTAVVTFISVTRGRINNIPFSNRRTRMYDVWIKKNGEWKAVSSQVTPIQ
jgi:hypothetical protein